MPEGLGDPPEPTRDGSGAPLTTAQPPPAAAATTATLPFRSRRGLALKLRPPIGHAHCQSEPGAGLGARVGAGLGARVGPQLRPSRRARMRALSRSVRLTAAPRAEVAVLGRFPFASAGSSLGEVA